MPVVFNPKSLLYCPSFFFPESRGQKLSNFIAMSLVFTPKNSVVLSSFIFPESCGLLSWCEHSNCARKKFSKFNYSPKTQVGDGDHQNLSNFIVMAVVFTPKSLLKCPSFIFPESLGLPSGCKHSIWAQNPFSNFNLLQKTVNWRR